MSDGIGNSFSNDNEIRGSILFGFQSVSEDDRLSTLLTSFSGIDFLRLRAYSV